MLMKICLGLALLGALPVWSQVEPSATGGAVIPDTDSQMATPPPVNGQAYPATVGAETRTNYLAVGITANAAYNDNVLPGYGTQPVSDELYSIWPAVTFSKTTPRQSGSLIYNSGYTFYQHTSALDYLDQNAAFTFQHHFSARTTVNLSDTFSQSSGVFNQPSSFSGGGISGSTSTPTQAIIAPYANQITNAANVGLTYQFAKDAMIGGSASTALFDFPNPSQVAGLDNSQSYGGSGFYDRRLSKDQYFGVVYQYLRTTTTPVQSTTQTSTPSLFYTRYFNKTVSLSLVAGPEYVDSSEPGAPSYQSWTPSIMASLGWQKSHVNFAANLMRSVAAAQGLPGVFITESATGSAQWQIVRTWTAGLSASYSNFQNATPVISQGYPGGHTVMGTASVQHVLSEQFSAQFVYTRLHESYGGIAQLSTTPDSNQESVSITYQFRKPLGR